jgi:hypothetical protein
MPPPLPNTHPHLEDMGECGGEDAGVTLLNVDGPLKQTLRFVRGVISNGQRQRQLRCCARCAHVLLPKSLLRGPVARR